VLAVLIPKFDECRQEFNGTQTRKSLYALRSMSYERWHPRLRSAEKQFDEQAVSNALYGLQNMSSDVREMQHALTALVPKIEERGA
jgi:hypothetical protein